MIEKEKRKKEKEGKGRVKKKSAFCLEPISELIRSSF